MASSQASQTSFNPNSASRFICHPRDAFSKDSTPTSSPSVAQLERELRDAREKIASLEASNDRRRKQLASIEVLNEDSKAALRREICAHEEVKRSNQRLQDQLAESREREADLTWQIGNLEKTLGDQSSAATESRPEPGLVENLETNIQAADLQNRTLRFALQITFRFIPEAKRQTSYEQVYNYAKEHILAKIEGNGTPEGTLPSPTRLAAVGADPRTPVRAEPSLSLPLRKKRKADEGDGLGERENNSPAPPEGLLSPPPSARKKQPGRRVKSQAPGFYTELPPPMAGLRRR